jgi:hypothetical protein
MDDAFNAQSHCTTYNDPMGYTKHINREPAKQIHSFTQKSNAAIRSPLIRFSSSNESHLLRSIQHVPEQGNGHQRNRKLIVDDSNVVSCRERAQSVKAQSPCVAKSVNAPTGCCWNTYFVLPIVITVLRIPHKKNTHVPYHRPSLERDFVCLFVW